MASIADSAMAVFGIGAASRFDEAIGGFERAATELVGAGGGRVVKMIGDEVRFVNADPVAACSTALALLDAVHEDAKALSLERPATTRR